MPLKISKDTMIGELVMNYPQAVEVLYMHGFHCIGCGLSAYETLEQGAMAHGYDEETIKQIVKEIQAKVDETGEKGAAGAPETKVKKEDGTERNGATVPPGANVKMNDEQSALALPPGSKKASAKTKKKKSEPG